MKGSTLIAPIADAIVLAKLAAPTMPAPVTMPPLIVPMPLTAMTSIHMDMDP